MAFSLPGHRDVLQGPHARREGQLPLALPDAS